MNIFEYFPYFQYFSPTLTIILWNFLTAFLTYQMKDSTFNAWIGLNDINSEHTFLWTDGRGVHYTNWGKGYPGGRRSSLSYEDVNITFRSPLCTLWVCFKSWSVKNQPEYSLIWFILTDFNCCRLSQPWQGVQIQLRILQLGGRWWWQWGIGKTSSSEDLSCSQRYTATQSYQLFCVSVAPKLFFKTYLFMYVFFNYNWYSVSLCISFRCTA